MMQKRNILILEDKAEHREALQKLVNEVAANVCVYVAADTGTAFRIIMEHHIHLFLVDIVLCQENKGDVSGLQFAKEIRNIKKYQFTPLIFVTALEDPKLHTYSELHCYSYIEKPFDANKVKDVVLQVLMFPVVDDMERHMYFKKDGIIYSKRIKDIIYIESERRKVIIYSKDEMLEVPYKTFEELECELDSNFFVRCSRYTIINKTYIHQIDYPNRYVRLHYIDKPIEIGISMKKRFKEQMGDM